MNVAGGRAICLSTRERLVITGKVLVRAQQATLAEESEKAGESKSNPNSKNYYLSSYHIDIHPVRLVDLGCFWRQLLQPAVAEQ